MNEQDASRQRKADYVAVFGSEAGKRVLRDLMRECYMFGPTYTPGDPHHTAFREGQRAVVTLLLNRSGAQWETPQAFAHDDHEPYPTGETNHD